MKPYPLTPAEWKEIMEVPIIRQIWGIEDDETVADFSALVYAVKFNFVSGSPGYAGDLFILQGDALTDAAPTVLRRNDNGALMVL